ncbi:hypothetical protein ACFLV4_00990 [Chloroflexota bacterium]
MAIDDMIISFPCPECKQEFRVGLYQLYDGGVVICPSCLATNAETELKELERDLNGLGKSLEICREVNTDADLEELAEAELKEIERELKGLGKSLKNLKKCLDAKFGLKL